MEINSVIFNLFLVMLVSFVWSIYVFLKCFRFDFLFRCFKDFPFSSENLCFSVSVCEPSTHFIFHDQCRKRRVRFSSGLQEQQQLQVEFVQGFTQVQNGFFVKVTATAATSAAAATASARTFQYAFAEFAHLQRGPYRE